jgi:hypothetical protein
MSDGSNDLNLVADYDANGVGDIVFKTGTSERARIKADGSGAGLFSPVLAMSKTAQVNRPLTQWGSGREICGMYISDATLANHRYWFIASGALYQTQTPTSTAFVSKGLPAEGLTLGRNKLVYFKGNVYLQGLSSSVNKMGVWSAPPVDNPTTFTWSARLLTGAVGSSVIQCGLDTDGTYLYAAEYGDPTGGPSIYRSLDGTTWETVLTLASGVRHCHGVFPDPYNAGHVYAAFGDTGSTKLWRSTNYGATGSWTNVIGAEDGWQHVQISFTADWVYMAADSPGLSYSVMGLDRTTLTPRYLSLDQHQDIAIPGGVGGRIVTDAVFTSGSPTLTSATAAFTAQDVGRFIRGTQQVADRTFISAFVNATTVTMSANAGASVSSQTITIAGDTFAGSAYYGIVDPSSGIFYFASNDTTQGGGGYGLFSLDRPGGRVRLIDVLHSKPDNQMFIGDGYLWFSRYQRPLIAQSAT